MKSPFQPRGSQILAAFLVCLCFVFVQSSLAAPLDLFPLPQSVTFTGTTMPIGNSPWKIFAIEDSLIIIGAKRIQDAFVAHGKPAPQIVTSDPGSNVILLGSAGKHGALGSAISAAGYKADASDIQVQGYSLAFNEANRKVLVMGKDQLGALYGCTTLEQLIQGIGGGAGFVCSRIQDWPDIKVRIWGSMNGYGTWDSRPEWTSFFKQRFTKFIHEHLIPNRINVVSMRFGGYLQGGYLALAKPSEKRSRLKWMIEQVKKHGMDMEYHDRGAVGYGVSLRNTPPYNEILFHQGHYVCYSRDALLRDCASKMGQFMMELGFTRIYLHQFDGTDGGWSKRCASCRTRWPSDGSAALAEGQANLVNIFYDEISKRIPNIGFVTVQSKYHAAALHDDVYHTMLNAKMHPQILPIVRETNRTEIAHVRNYYPNRALFGDWQLHKRYRSPFQMEARFCRDYFFPAHPRQKEDVIVMVVNKEGPDKMANGLFSYYAWNVHAPGSEPCPGSVKGTKRDYDLCLNTASPARKVLDQVAKFQYGPVWGPKAVEASLTWLGAGVVDGKMPGWAWPMVYGWFPVVQNAPEAQKKEKFLQLFLAEARRMEPIIERILAANPEQVPQDLFRIYSTVKRCAIMAEPIYWEERCKNDKDPANYTAGYRSVQTSLAKYSRCLEMVGWCDVWARIPWKSDSPKKTLNLYKAFFASKADTAAHFTSPNFVTAYTGQPFSYTAAAHVKAGVTPSLQFTKKPAWTSVAGTSIKGTTPNTPGSIYSMEVVLKINGAPYDTLKVSVLVANPPVPQPHEPVTPPAGGWGALRGLSPRAFGVSVLANAGNRTQFAVSLERPSNLYLNAYDVIGRRVYTHRSVRMPAGVHRVEWQRNDASGNTMHNGVYFLVAEQTAGNSERKSMTKRFTTMKK